MHFTKMQGLGNDYLYVYGDVPENIAAISQKLSDRHFGAGSDWMIYISPSDKADFNRTTKTNGVSYIIQRGGAAVFTPEGQAQIA